MSLERRLGLKDDERLLGLARAAAVTIALPALAVSALAVAPFFFLLPLLRLETLGYVLMGIAWTIALWCGLRGWLTWRGTFLAVTDRRLMFRRRYGFFARHATELPLARVQEVSYRVTGFFPTLFGYGTLFVESSGSEKPLEIARVPDPQRLQRLVTEMQDEDEEAGDGTFPSLLQAVSRLDGRQLRLLKAEIERTERFLTPERS